MSENDQQTSASRQVRGWRAFVFDRLIGTVCVWALVVIGSVGAIINALGAPGSWGEALVSAAAAAGAAFMGRTWVVAAAVDGEVLRVRRLLPGRMEAIPLSRIRSAQHVRIAFGDSISLRFSALAFATMRYYGFPRSQREPWLALLADLRQALGDRWHE